MNKKHHPQDRQQRKRLAEAKALASPLFRQRKINSKRRQKLVEIQDKESQNEFKNSDYELGDSY